MSSEFETQGPAKFREIANKLRGIARQVRYDLCRVDQLHALAAGFDRLADRTERDAKHTPEIDAERARFAAPETVDLG
jgi:hypothetical protein